MVKKYKSGEKVHHSNLGEGVFVSYDLYNNEVIVEFEDELGYKDELRVSESLLNKLEEN